MNSSVKDRAIRQAWQIGYLEHLLDSNQQEILEFIRKVPADVRISAVNMSRRGGKTFLAAVYATSFAIQNPKSIVRFIAPKQNQAHSILLPIMREVLDTCPDDLKPTWKVTKGCYEFPNGSSMFLQGADVDQGNRLRGVGANLVILDECRDFSDLTYVIQSILLPQVLSTKGRIILISTPPVPGHPFVGYLRRAEARGAYIERDIWKVPRYSKEEIESWATEYPGGMESVEWRREYLCELLTDPNTALIPEFKKAKHVGQVDRNQPFLDDIYVFLDWGFKHDYTGIILSHWDFKRQKLIITREILEKGIGIDEAAQALKKALVETYPDPNQPDGYRKPYLMVGDAEGAILQHFSKHQLYFSFPSKPKKSVQIANTRLWFSQDKVLVSPECPHLSRQLAEGQWKDTTREDWERDSNDGHWDLGAALNYGLASIVENRNPYPPNRDFSDRQRPREAPISPEGQALQSIFRPRWK